MVGGNYYIGGLPVQKLMLGSTQVWQKEVIPSGNYLPNFQPLLYSEVSLPDGILFETNGVWTRQSGAPEVSAFFPYRMVEGSELAFKVTDDENQYFTMGVYTNEFKAVGADGDDLDAMLFGRLSNDYFTVFYHQYDAGDWIIIKYNNQTLDFYKTTNGIDRVKLTLPNGYVYDGIGLDNQVAFTLYGYNGRKNVKLYYPQGKGLAAI